MAKNEACSSGCFKTSIGGQALIEGIMMRGPEKQAIVCRKADGSLTSKIDGLKPTPKTPFIRGVVIFISSLVNGMNALTWSAEQQPEEDQDEPTKFDLWLEKKFGTEAAQKAIIGIAAVLGVLLAVGLFVLLPSFLFELLPEGIHLIVRCILEGIIRIVIFLLYLWLCTRMNEIKRQRKGLKCASALPDGRRPRCCRR